MYEVFAQGLGVIYRVSDRLQAEDFGRWYRDVNAVQVRIYRDYSDSALTVYPVNV